MKAEYVAASTPAGVQTGKRVNSELASEFATLIAKFQEQANADMIKRKQAADEKAAEEAKEKKEERINELLAMIARIKAKLGLCGAGGNSALEAELAMLEGELLMLLLFS